MNFSIIFPLDMRRRLLGNLVGITVNLQIVFSSMLENCGHRETVQWCRSSDHTPSSAWQLLIRAPPAARWKEVHWEHSRWAQDQTAQPANPLDLTTSRSNMTEPTQAGAGIGCISQPRTLPLPNRMQSCVLRKKRWEVGGPNIFSKNSYSAKTAQFPSLQ